MNEQQVSTHRAMVTQIETMLRVAPQNWTSYLPSARFLMQNIDAGLSADFNDWIRTVTALQELGFADVDRGGDPIVTRWCNSQWLSMLAQRPNSSAVLRGTHSIQNVTICSLTAHQGWEAIGYTERSHHLEGSMPRKAVHRLVVALVLQEQEMVVFTAQITWKHAGC